MISKILYSSMARRVFQHVRGIPVFGGMIVRFANSRSLGYVQSTKDKLSTMSPSFCSAKWLQSTIYLGIGQTHSCHHPARHFIDIKKLATKPSSLHNTEEKIKARQEMVRGEYPKECSYCWKVEETGNFSDRVYKSGEIWAATDLNKLATNKMINEVNPTYLELSFSSECNLSCSYCDPNISNSIKREIQKFGPYPTSDHFQNLSEVEESQRVISESPKALKEYFWDWWEDLKPDLQTLRITGGEPLLAKELHDLLHRFDQGHLPKLDLSITSNLMVGQKAIEDFILKCKSLIDQKKIKNFHLYTSIDTWGDHAEFLRWGLDIKKFTANVETCLSLYSDLKITFLVTYQALSPFKFNQFLEFILDLRKRYPEAEIKVGTSSLTYPAFLSLDLLDKTFSHYLDGNLSFMKERRLTKQYPFGFSEFEIKRFERIVDTFKSSGNNQVNVLNDFRVFVTEYEKRKGIKFDEYFADFQDICKLLQNN